MNKRLLHIFILCLMPLAGLLAQEKIALTANVGYGYNPTWQSFGEAFVAAKFRAADNFYFHVGTDYKIHQAATVKGSGKVFFPVRKVALFLDNSYLYSAFFNDNFQQFNTALSFGVETKHFTGSLGWFGRWFFPIKAEEGAMSNSIFEPLNLAYSFEGRIFPKEHHWNMSLEIANVGQFEFERATNPIFTLTGGAVVVEHLSVHGAVIAKPAGMGHLAANGYQVQIQTGITYVW